MPEKDQTATAVLDQELVDEIIKDEGRGDPDQGRMVRLKRDGEAEPVEEDEESDISG